MASENSAVRGMWQEQLGASRPHFSVLAALVADSVALAGPGHLVLRFPLATEGASVQN